MMLPFTLLVDMPSKAASPPFAPMSSRKKDTGRPSIEKTSSEDEASAAACDGATEIGARAAAKEVAGWAVNAAAGAAEQLLETETSSALMMQSEVSREMNC
jgi:hypothetical protein